MTLFYITADQIGTPTGGGTVTFNESLALREFSEEQTQLRRNPVFSSVQAFHRDNLGSDKPEPWKWDDTLVSRQDFQYLEPKLAHFYSGTFSKTVASLKKRDCKTVYTIAAHDVAISRREHEKMGVNFSQVFPHLCEPSLWSRYIEGYKLADVIVCPSTIAEKTVRAYGPDFENKDIRIITHGCTLPKEEDIKPLPPGLIVGYLGAMGADKGVRYLLEVWKKLNYQDGSLLILAGRDSTTIGKHLLEKYGGGNVYLAGWQKNVRDFYNSINLYVQPSATEGFGCEVLEAMSYKRPVLCSKNAGASDLISDSVFDPDDIDKLCFIINEIKTNGRDWMDQSGKINRMKSEFHSWEIIRSQYKQLLGSLI